MSKLVIPLGSSVVKLGIVCVTRGAAAKLEESQAREALTRHMMGDWGEIEEEDWKLNERALIDGTRIVSSYLMHDRRVLVITEADRSATTILLPEEY